MISIILLIQIIVSILLIIVVLLQQGKGANAGAAFGSGGGAGGGGANSLFGSKGPASFMFKLTCLLCAIFFITSLMMGYLTSRETKKASSFEWFKLSFFC